MAITKLEPLTKIKALPKIQPLQPLKAVPKLQALPSLAYKPETLYVNKGAGNYANYNDPYELNSFADAALNNRAIKKASKGWGWFSWVESVPIVRNVAAAIDVAWNKGIKPAIEGDWKAVGINTLMNIGETLDIVANPVKGLLMEGGDGFIKGLGVGKGGRVNYDWNTGNWVADLGLEIITDPLNWFSFGGKSIMSGGAKKAIVSGGTKAGAKETLVETTEKIVKETAQSLSKKVGKEITEDVIQKVTKKVTRRVVKSATRTLVDYTTEAIENAAKKEVKRLTKKGVKTTIKAEVEKLLLKRTEQLKAIIIDELIKNVPDAAKALLRDVNSIVFKTLSKSIDNLLSGMQWDVLAKRINKTVATLYNASESFERFLFKSAFMTSGLGLGYKAVRVALDTKLASEFIENTFMRNLRKAKYLDANNVVDIFKYDQAKQLYSESYKLARTITEEPISRQSDTFYRMIQHQFQVDETILREIAQTNVKQPEVALSAMEKYIQQRYKGASLVAYFDQVKKINAEENGFYGKYVQYLNRLQTRITNLPSTKIITGNKGLVIGKLYNQDVLKEHQKILDRYLKTIDAINKGKDVFDNLQKKVKYSADTVYMQLKFNELYVQSQLIGNTVINKFLTDIKSGADGTLGAVIKNILSDPHAYEHDSVVRQLAQILNDSATNVKYFEEFANDVLNTLYKIDGVSLDEFRVAILDTLYSFNALKASDVVTNIDTTVPELINKIEEMLNAQNRTAIAGRTRISVPEETRFLLKEQLLQYASSVSSTNADAYLCYPLAKDFTNALIQFQKKVSEQFDTTQVTEAIVEIANTFKAAQTFKDTQSFFQKNIFIDNKELLHKYISGSPVDVTAALYYGLHGPMAYGIREAIDMHHLHRLFNFVEGEMYSVNLMEYASDFTKTWLDFTNRLNTELIEQYFSEAVRTELAEWLQILTQEYKLINNKLNYPGLEILEHLKLEALDVREQFAVLQSLFKLKNEIGEDFLTAHFGRMLSNTRYANISGYLINPKKLTPQPVMFNPQYYLKTAVDNVYYQDLAKAVDDYNAIADPSSQIFKGIKNFNDALKQTQDNVSPLVQLNERHIKIANDVNNNVLRYTENKMQSLWDQDLADELLKEYKDYLSPEDYALLQKFYSEDLLTAEEYTHLMEATNKAIAQKSLVEHKEIVENHKEVLSKRQKEGFKRVKEETSKHLTVSEFESALAQNRSKPISADWNGTVSEATLPSGEKVYLWTRTRMTTEPFETLPEYDPKYMSIGESTYNEDYATYSTEVTEAFKDLDYLNYRLEYRKDWTAQQRLVKAYSLVAKDPSLNIQQALVDTVGRNKRGFIRNPELLERMQNVNENLRSKYSDEMSDALDYARGTEWHPQIKTLKDEFLNEYASKDFYKDLEELLKKNRTRKKVFEKLETLFKKTLPEEEYRQLHRDLNKLFKNIEDAPYVKIQEVINSMHRDLHKQLGVDLQNLYMQRFKEPSNQIYQEWVKSLPKPAYRDIEEPFAKQKAYHNQLKQATDKHSQAMLAQFLSLSPEEMQKELVFRGRIVMFGSQDFINDPNMKALYNQFRNYKSKELEQLGVKIVDDQDMTIVYLSKDYTINVLDGQYYLNNRPLTRTYTPLEYNEFDFDPHLQREFRKYNNYLEELTGYSPNTGMGDIMDKDLLETMYNGFDESTITKLKESAKDYGEAPEYWRGLPDAVKNDLPTLAEMTKSNYFEHYKFNESILGSAISRKRIQAYTPNNMIKTVKNTMEQVGVHLKAKVEYIDGIMDSIYSISKGSYANYTDAEILEALVRSPRYRLCYLKQDKKYGMKLVEIPALNIEAIKEARRLNAVILPRAVYTRMYNVVNHRLGGSGFFKLWNRIMYIYKFGYLFNPGTIARNWIDTNLKTDMELGPEARMFKRQARDYIRQYKEISKRVSDINDGLVTRKGLEEFFTNIQKDPEFTIKYDTYMMLDDFFKNGPVTDISKQPSLMDMGGGDLWRTFTNLTSSAMNWANQTEEVNRLAMYLSGLNQGLYKHDAWERIAKVHFDYAFKTRAEELIEAIFPFSTFAVRNISYWVDTLLKHPEFIGLFRDVYTPIWNFDDLTPEQLNASRSLQYQIINGNINLFDVNDTEYIARINPSIFDAINSVVNPVQAIQNKLASPIQDAFSVITGQEAPDVEMLPVVGVIKQRLEKAVNEKNVLPSLMTKRKKFTPKPSTWRNYNLNNYGGIENTSNPYYVLPKVRSDVRIDPLRTIGTKAFTSRMMAAPKVKVDVYNKVYYKHHIDVYQGLRYQLTLNINKFK